MPPAVMWVATPTGFLSPDRRDIVEDRVDETQMRRWKKGEKDDSSYCSRVYKPDLSLPGNRKAYGGPKELQGGKPLLPLIMHATGYDESCRR